MPVVFDNVELPGTQYDVLARVVVSLVTSASDSAAAGYIAASDLTILDKFTQYTNGAGYVAFTLRSNTLILPANSYYIWETHFEDGRVNRRYIRVPNTSGPFHVSDIEIAAANPMQAAFGPSSATVRRTTAQSIPNNTATAVTFEAAVYQNGDTPQWSAGAPTRLTAPADGEYIFGGYVRWSANATGIRGSSLIVNGAFSVGNDERVAGSGSVNPSACVSGFYYLPAGWFIELRVFQNSGGALTIDDAGFDDTIRMWMKRVG